MPIVSLKDKTPAIDPTAFLAGNATVIGDVHIGAQSSVWYGAVIRGDIDQVRIGRRTNIQDNTVIHVDRGFPTFLGDEVTVGHQVMLHGCTVKDRVLVGIGSILLDGVIVESESMIAANSLLTPGTKVPSGVLVMGSPAKVRRELTREEIAFLLESAQHYVETQVMHR